LFLGGEELPWYKQSLLVDTRCRDAVNEVPTDVTAVFTWQMCNEDLDYPIYLNATSTNMRFDDVELVVPDIGTPVEPRTCRTLVYRHVLDLCDVNPDNGDRKAPLRVQMQGRLARGGEEESEDDEFCYCKYDLGSPVESQSLFESTYHDLTEFCYLCRLHLPQVYIQSNR